MSKHGLSREEQIRRLQESMEDPKDQSYHFQSVNQTYQGGGESPPAPLTARLIKGRARNPSRLTITTVREGWAGEGGYPVLHRLSRFLTTLTLPKPQPPPLPGTAPTGSTANYFESRANEGKGEQPRRPPSEDEGGPVGEGARRRRTGEVRGGRAGGAQEGGTMRGRGGTRRRSGTGTPTRGGADQEAAGEAERVWSGTRGGGAVVGGGRGRMGAGGFGIRSPRQGRNGQGDRRA